MPLQIKTMADFPQDAKQVLDLIAEAEHVRTFAWTAGRVIKKSGLSKRLDEFGFDCIRPR
jgi:hypothetical protein